MSLIDIIHAQQAAARGEHNVELKLVGKILEDAQAIDVAAMSKELASKSMLMSKSEGKIASFISKSVKRSVAGVALAASLFFGGSEALAWDTKFHEKSATAIGATVPSLAAKADRFRTFDHWVNEPLKSAEMQKAIDRVFAVSRYDALHLIADYGNPLHVYTHNDWNKKVHKAFDSAAGFMTPEELMKIPAATGDIRENIRGMILEGNKIAADLEKAGQQTLPPEIAASRAKRAVSVMKQYRAMYGDEKFIFSATDDILTKSNKLTDLVESVVALTDKSKKLPSGKYDEAYITVKDMLRRTAIHESFQLRYVTQLEQGPAKSIFQIEGATAVDVVQRWAKLEKNSEALAAMEKASGLTRKRLLTMSQDALEGAIKENQLFAGVVARYRYKMDPGIIPTTLEDQAVYWQKAYQRGGKAVAQNRIDSFLTSNREFDRKVSAAMMRQQTVRSKAGNATTKAVKTLKKIIPR